MKMKKTVVTAILAITVIGAIFFIAKSYNLKQKLTEVEEQQAKLYEKLDGYEQLIHIDSMLLEGEYDSAIESYNATMEVRKENKLGIPLRIALAEKLLHNYEGARNSRKQVADDTLLRQTSETPLEIRKYDSLNFTLEKTKVQLTRLKERLKQKSFGEYLKFESTKGNQMHYVGQVKNGKANGFGIALLDTGSRYEGEWTDNARQGQGTFYWPDGEYYVGTYTNDRRSGYGTYYWPNGEKYAGEWKEDKRSGSGKFFDAAGEVVADGEWNDDELVKVDK